jgi:uncharacterized protein YceK
MKKIAIILMAIITLSSCMPIVKTHTKALKGRIVFKKALDHGKYYFELNDKETFGWVRVHEVHFRQYKVGDTIK